MNLQTEQLNILLSTIKDIISIKSCPEWVIKRLTEGVAKAKNISKNATQETAGYEIDYEYRPYNIGDEVVSNIDGDSCIYKITGTHDPINGINLYTLQIIKGNKTNPPGHIAYNVPETMLLHIKRN